MPSIVLISASQRPFAKVNGVHHKMAPRHARDDGMDERLPAIFFCYNDMSPNAFIFILREHNNDDNANIHFVAQNEQDCKRMSIL